jgi:hypothetical protein
LVITSFGVGFTYGVHGSRFPTGDEWNCYCFYGSIPVRGTKPTKWRVFLCLKSSKTNTFIPLDVFFISLNRGPFLFDEFDELCAKQRHKWKTQ